MAFGITHVFRNMPSRISILVFGEARLTTAADRVKEENIVRPGLWTRANGKDQLEQTHCRGRRGCQDWDSSARLAKEAWTTAEMINYYSGCGARKNIDGEQPLQGREERRIVILHAGRRQHAGSHGCFVTILSTSTSAHTNHKVPTSQFSVSELP
ncbi:hypothetical protein BDR04DRAFT_1119109 [Suillus decipiens]|nr:hypothetical protein BDR04DRAFT_1119109 [Suillus decipiens]